MTWQSRIENHLNCYVVRTFPNLIFQRETRSDTAKSTGLLILVCTCDWILTNQKLNMLLIFTIPSVGEGAEMLHCHRTVIMDCVHTGER